MTLIARIRRWLTGRQVSPEIALRRAAERRAAEADMRAHIERATLMFGRTGNRFVR